MCCEGAYVCFHGNGHESIDLYVCMDLCVHFHHILEAVIFKLLIHLIYVSNMSSIALYGQTTDHLTNQALANVWILFVHCKQNCNVHPFNQCCMHLSLREGSEGVNRSKGVHIL